MYVRCRRRFKDGKEHRYWSVVESCRRRDGRVVQRQVLHLGEINDGQRAAWCRAVVREGSDRLRKARRREGRYLLRSNLAGETPETLWRHYMRLTEVEQVFKELKSDLAVRPVFHRLDARVEAHVFLAFVGYCLLVTLKNMARKQAPGLTPRAVIEKFAAIQMVDVHLPTSDGRELVLTRHTQPDDDHRLLLHQLGLRLPEQPPPRIRAQ